MSLFQHIFPFHFPGALHSKNSSAQPHTRAELTLLAVHGGLNPQGFPLLFLISRNPKPTQSLLQGRGSSPGAEQGQSHCWRFLCRIFSHIHGIVQPWVIPPEPQESDPTGGFSKRRRNILGDTTRALSSEDTLAQTPKSMTLPTSPTPQQYREGRRHCPFLILTHPLSLPPCQAAQ